MRGIPILLALSHMFLSELHEREGLLNKHFIRYTYYVFAQCVSRDLLRLSMEGAHYRTTTNHILFSVCGGDTSVIRHNDLLYTRTF